MVMQRFLGLPVLLLAGAIDVTSSSAAAAAWFPKRYGSNSVTPPAQARDLDRQKPTQFRFGAGLNLINRKRGTAPSASSGVWGEISQSRRVWKRHPSLLVEPL